MSFEEKSKVDRFGCGMMMCSIKEEYIRQQEEFSHIIEEKDREIKALKTIQNNLETIKISKEDILSIFNDLINDIHPFYTYLIKKAKSVEKITTVLVRKEEDFFDIWFIINESDFLLETKIAEIFCDLVKRFSALLFDILIIAKKKVNLDNLGEKGFKVIYIKN